MDDTKEREDCVSIRFLEKPWDEQGGGVKAKKPWLRQISWPSCIYLLSSFSSDVRNMNYPQRHCRWRLTSRPQRRESYLWGVQSREKGREGGRKRGREKAREGEGETTPTIVDTPENGHKALQLRRGAGLFLPVGEVCTYIRATRLYSIDIV